MRLALDSSHEGFEHSTRIVRRGTTAQRNVFLKKVRLKMLAEWDASCKSYCKHVPKEFRKSQFISNYALEQWQRCPGHYANILDNPFHNQKHNHFPPQSNR